jgi:spermidine synthase
MLPWVHLDTASVPGDDTPLRLSRRGTEFSIRLGQVELMNSRLNGSEKALATLTCARLVTLSEPRILIGGLGMGFTLRAALGVLGPHARIVVAELVPAVVAWARGPMAGLFEGCLSDPRVTIRQADVGAIIAGEPAGFDAILLDVDNGPEGLTRRDNDRLYDAQGLATTRKALRPNGVLAVWSAFPDPAFARRLGRAGFDVAQEHVRATGRTGSRHIIWLATRGQGAR